MNGICFLSKFLNKEIIIRPLPVWLVAGQLQRSLYKIDYETRDLGSQYIEIVGKEYKQDPYA